MVVESDTVVDPLAVVVEFRYAFVADIAMAGVRGTGDFTLWAQ